MTPGKKTLISPYGIGPVSYTHLDVYKRQVMQRDAEVKLWGWCPSVWDLKIVCSWAPNDTVHVSSDKYKY